MEGTERGEPVFLGDAARREFLRRAGAPGARAFVVTVNSARAAERMVVAARKERPDVPVFARARDPAHASRLLELGAAEVTLEAVEASLASLGLWMEHPLATKGWCHLQVVSPRSGMRVFYP